MLRDDLGAPVELPAQPRRIVSLVPSLTETMAHLGLGERLVAVTDYCVWPADLVAGLPRVRGTKNPDVRRVIELAPDLIVANEEENRELDVRRLREAGLAVYVTRVRTVADAARSLARVADAVGAGSAGQRLAGEIEAAIDEQRGAGPSVRVACPVWRDPWFWVGPDTFAGSMLGTAGATLVPMLDDRRYPRAPLEDVLADAPESLLLPDEPYAFTADDAEELARSTPARIELIEGAALTWWGPRTPAALRGLAARLAPRG